MKECSLLSEMSKIPEFLPFRLFLSFSPISDIKYSIIECFLSEMSEIPEFLPFLTFQTIGEFQKVRDLKVFLELKDEAYGSMYQVGRW